MPHVPLPVCILFRSCNVFNVFLKETLQTTLCWQLGPSLDLRPSIVVTMVWLVYLAFRLLLAIRDLLEVMSYNLFELPDWAEGRMQRFGLRVIHKLWKPINPILMDLELQLEQNPEYVWVPQQDYFYNLGVE